MNLDLICLHIALGLHPIVQVHEASNVLPRFSFEGRTQIFSKKANLDFPLAEQLIKLHLFTSNIIQNFWILATSVLAC